MLSASSLTFIAHMAWREADRKALESEQLRFANALLDIHRQIAGGQIDLAHWDATFKALKTPIDKEFIEEELIEDLWEDYGLDRSFLVDHSGSLIAHANMDDVTFETVNLPEDNLLHILATDTKDAWLEKRLDTGALLAEWYLPKKKILEMSQSAFADLDGNTVLLSSIPILPDGGAVDTTSVEPTILINAIHLDDTWISELSAQLSFDNLRYISGTPARPHPTNYLVLGADGSVLGHFRWNHAKPGREIWKMALPLVLLLAAVIAAVAILAAFKITRLSRSLEDSERKNRYFANHDALTGLANRHQFSDCIRFAIDELPDRPFAVLACDLDRFKPVNDTYGHEAGDKVICVVADRLRKLVGEDGIVSRVGGDEFFILITRPADQVWLQNLASQMRASIAAQIDIGPGESTQIGISIGIACAPDVGLTETDIIRAADAALYQAKDKGRDTFVFAQAPASEIRYSTMDTSPKTNQNIH